EIQWLGETASRADVQFMRDRVFMEPNLKNFKETDLIFEGSQGLLLDQNRSWDMPHLTRANTGLQNVVKICNELGIEDLSAVYVSRTYLTRHGAGPLAGEAPIEQVVDNPNPDETNITNQYQGVFRYAPLDKDRLFKEIQADVDKYSAEFGK